MARQATFANFIKKERTRLDKARKDALANKAAVESELASIEQELIALDAYRQAKDGPARRTAAKRASSKRTPAKRAGANGARRATGRRGEKRQAVLNLIMQNPVGLSRGEILVQMGVKGNRSAEQSVSNALSALKKSEKVNSREGKYVPA
jgi:hypothetical protein